MIKEAIVKIVSKEDLFEKPTLPCINPKKAESTLILLSSDLVRLCI